MQIVYTKHARLRMAQRNISEADVEQILSDPDITYDDPDGNRCFVREVAGRRLRIVSADHTDPPVIVTVIG